MNFSKLLESKVSQLKRNNVIVTIGSGTDVNDAVATLFKSGSQSCPVIDKDGKLVGLIDVVDVAVHCVNVLGGAKKMLQWMAHSGFIPVADKDQYEVIIGKDTMTKEELMKGVKEDDIEILNLAKELIDHSQRNPCVAIKETSSVRQLLTLLKTTHRVPVIDDAGKVINLVTQSDVIAFLKYDETLLGEFGDKTLKELGLAEPKPVVSVNQCAQALDAFKAIKTHNITAVAIVDDDGLIVGNISATDVRVIGSSADLITRLFLPCSEFIKRMQTEYIIPTKPLTVLESNTLNDTLQMMVEQKVHRVYLVTDKIKQKPISVVSMTDVLNSVKL